MKKLFFLFFLHISLYAHPHFFVDASLKIKEKTIKHIWIFDKINSRLLMFDFDINKNKKLEKEEETNFLQKHFFSLKKDNYNLFIENNEEEIEINPQKVRAVFSKRRIIITFYTNIKLQKDSTLCTIDPLVYMAFKINKINTTLDIDIIKSEYDYCIGVK